MIYFSEGPYIEILEKVHIPIYAKPILHLIGKRRVMDRLDRWNTEKEGYIDLCLENYTTDLRKEEEILKEYEQRYYLTKSKRLDPVDRLLEWKLLFPEGYRQGT